jgi:Tfp pilus assembly protein PilE
MDKKTKNLLIVGALGLGALFLFNNSNAQQQLIPIPIGSSGSSPGVSVSLPAPSPDEYYQNYINKILGNELANMQKQQELFMQSLQQEQQQVLSQWNSLISRANTLLDQIEYYKNKAKEEAASKKEIKTAAGKFVEEGYVLTPSPQSVAKLADEGKVAVMPAAVSKKEMKKNVEAINQSLEKMPYMTF